MAESATIDAWIPISIAVIAVIIAIVVIIVQYYRAFLTKPLQATIRALVGILILLAGTAVAPSLSINGNVEVYNTTMTVGFSTSMSMEMAFLVWGSVILVLIICLLRVPKKPK